jgi:hypothetical protein
MQLSASIPVSEIVFKAKSKYFQNSFYDKHDGEDIIGVLEEQG